MSSPTRGVFAGGEPANTVIDFVTLATLGNATDFGDLTTASSLQNGSSGASSSTIGIFGQGSAINMDKIVIASQGNAIDYGDLSVSRNNVSAMSNSHKAIFAGGNNSIASNVMDFVLINVGGTATDFGDLNSGVNRHAGLSAAHGGLNDGYQGTR